MGFRKRTEVLLAASAFLCVAVILGSPLFGGTAERRLSTVALLICGVCSVACILGFLLCVDMYRLNPADSHTLYTLLFQYRSLLLLKLKMPYIKWFLNKQLMNPKKESEEALLRILNWNQNSVYGQEHKFSEMKSREDFVRMHPFTTQDHYKPYVDRIIKGETNVLHGGETAALIGTSGTTGISKVYPYTAEFIKEGKSILGKLCPLTFIHMLNLQRYAQFHIYSQVKKSIGGIPMGAGTQFMFSFPPHNLIPDAYSKLHSEDASYYAQAVFSLAERELRYISGFSADLMYSYWKFIMKHWNHLCEDISNGEIGHHVSMPEDVRVELSGCLKADPARAAELRMAMKRGIVGLAKCIWVDMEFILMGKSAAFKMCAGILMENQFKGLKVIDFCHGATEGISGLNLEGDVAHVDQVFTLVLFSACFVEFVPLEAVEEDNPATVFPEKLKVGRLYEVVHTNVNGLYRNRYGDIIKVVGFNGNTPKYKFVYKLGQRLNIAYERTPDKYLIEAIGCHQDCLPENIHIVNFTTTESVVIEKMTGNSSKGHYVFFVEFDTDKEVNEMDLAEKIDRTLLESYQQYKRFRDIDSIGSVRLIQVRPGTFDGLKTYIWNNTPHGQFKMPRVLRREPALKYLLDQALHPQGVHSQE